MDPQSDALVAQLIAEDIRLDDAHLTPAIDQHEALDVVLGGVTGLLQVHEAAATLPQASSSSLEETVIEVSALLPSLLGR